MLNNPLVYLFCKTWQYSKGNKKSVAIFWSMFILAEGLEIVIQPLLWAKIIAVVQSQGVTQDSIKTILILLAFVLLNTIVFWAIHGPARVMECSNAFKVRLNYRKHLLGGVLAMPLGWHSANHSGDTIDKIDKGTGALYQFSEDTFEIIYSLVRFVVSYGMLVYFFPHSSYIVLIMMAIMAVIVMSFDKVLIRNYKNLNKIENQIVASIFDSISNITTVIVLRVEKLVWSSIISKNEKPFDLFRKNNILNETKWFLTALCCVVTTVIVMTAYFVEHIGVTGGILISNVYLLIQYLEKISQLFFRFTGMYADVIQRRAKVANAEILSDQFTDESLSNHVLPDRWSMLDIRDLSFSYENNEGQALHLDNISLSIRRGETIAFVGLSGSGKTTMLHLMRGLHKPNSIDLEVDGMKVEEGFDGIARAIALMLQDPGIFATTILQNITLGADYEPEIIARFIEMACFTEVVGNLPKGLESSINERGVNLSGGQKQRLALVRGLLACLGKEILLLDEPTASLDAITEREVYRRILNGFKGKTIISTIHRLHLLPMFDRVCVFSEGRIVASGTLIELERDCVEFQELLKQYAKESQ